MSHVEFKKWPCRRVNFSGPDPYNAKHKKSAKCALTAAKKKSDKICLKYNSEGGCTFKFCNFLHKCIVCEETGHPKKECKVVKRKDAK